MPQSASLALSQNAAVGLFFMQRYRFLTIDQYARVAHINRSTASDKQMALLQKLGVAIQPELTKGEAADQIAAILGDWD